MSSNDLLTASNVILDSLNDGVYVCDTERRIVFWNRAAERITGWSSSDVVGKRCLDGVLCHIDKDGHLLCGEEFCPLHRSMVTGTNSTVGVLVYAKTISGGRVPVEVSVSPIRDESGKVIGGVETFRDMSETLCDLNRAQRIQAMSLETDLPVDPRVSFTTRYVPHDVVGGDFYAIRKLDADHYGFLLADVMGHGIAAALHTMHLSSVWVHHAHLLVEPQRFVQTMNAELARVVKGESFATAICGSINAQQRTLRLACAGGPAGLVFRGDGGIEPVGITGFPLGMMNKVEFDEVSACFEPGDSLLFFSDGAVEIENAAGKELGLDGLRAILQYTGYPQAGLQLPVIEEQLLLHSNGIRLSDDLTFIEIRWGGHGQ